MKKKSGGWSGQMLRLNATDRSSRIVPTGDYGERFIGGVGLATKVAWDEIPPDVGALDPGNKLIFATGPLTGTLAPGSGRLEIMAKSPRTYPHEAVTRSGLGGHWGKELKQSGFDALILEGAAETPVYILIAQDSIDFFDAEELWGLDTYKTQKILHEKHGPDTQTLCIGPAGENKSRIAAIMSETSFASGKSGFGAVMGAKKVKAIVVNGRGGHIEVAHPGRLLKLADDYRNLLGVSPAREWTIGGKPADRHHRFFDKYRTGNASCFGCPLQCWAFIKVPGVDPSQAGCVNYYYMGPAYRYYGETVEADQALWLGNVLCNKLGLDTFELAGIAPFVREIYEAGLIEPDESGIPLSEFGSIEFISKLTEAIAYRRGLGDLLAEGAAVAAEKISGAWPIYEKYYPAHGQMEHNSVRDYPGIALFWALDSRDPMIDHHAYRHLSVTRLKWPHPHQLTVEQAEAIAKKIFGTPTAIDHRTYADKAAAVALCQNKSCVKNSLVLCDFLYPIFISQSREDRMGDTAAESQLFSAVTGQETSEAALDRIGERIVALSRAIMVREGRTRTEDTLHEAYFRDTEVVDPAAGKGTMRVILSSEHTKAVPRDQFEEAKTEYYRLRGWGADSGRPSRETLMELDLPEVAEALYPRQRKTSTSEDHLSTRKEEP